jgi:hypothetical protein
MTNNDILEITFKSNRVKRRYYKKFYKIYKENAEIINNVYKNAGKINYFSQNPLRELLETTVVVCYNEFFNITYDDKLTIKDAMSVCNDVKIPNGNVYNHDAIVDDVVYAVIRMFIRDILYENIKIDKNDREIRNRMKIFYITSAGDIYKFMKDNVDIIDNITTDVTPYLLPFEIENNDGKIKIVQKDIKENDVIHAVSKLMSKYQTLTSKIEAIEPAIESGYVEISRNRDYSYDFSHFEKMHKSVELISSSICYLKNSSAEKQLFTTKANELLGEFQNNSDCNLLEYVNDMLIYAYRTINHTNNCMNHIKITLKKNDIKSYVENTLMDEIAKGEKKIPEAPNDFVTKFKEIIVEFIKSIIHLYINLDDLVEDYVSATKNWFTDTHRRMVAIRDYDYIEDTKRYIYSVNSHEYKDTTLYMVTHNQE